MTQPQNMAGPQKAVRPVKILMVDDRAENLLALEAILSGLGHQLVRASSGREALKQLLVHDIALILLDVQMPGMDGFETAAHIKQRERTQDIPIVFLTAIDGGSHQAFRGYAAGAVDYLAKPFDPWVLRAKVNVFIELSERRREIAEQAERLAVALARFNSPDIRRRAQAALAAAQASGAAAVRSGDVAAETAAKEALREVEALVDALQAGGGP